MFLQCIAIGWIIFYLEMLNHTAALGETIVNGAGIVRSVLVWTAVLVTAFSGFSYCLRAARLFAERKGE